MIETGSVLESPDVSYLNNLHYQQHQRTRRRIESASDMDDQSLYSDDVRSFEIILVLFSYRNRLDRSHRPILLNPVSRRLNTQIC